MEAKYKVEIVSTDQIKHGDTVKWIDGTSRTVNRKDIDNGFTGITIFGNPLVLQDRKIKRFVTIDGGKLVADDNGETL